MLLALLVGFAGCGAPVPPPAPAPAASRCLAGAWSLALDVVEDPGGPPRRVTGTLVLAPVDSTAPQVWMVTMGIRARYTGGYGLDEPRFGPSGSGNRRAAAALLTNTVHAALGVGIGDGELVMRGTLAGDSVSGTWFQAAYMPLVRGRFVMHRTSAGSCASPS